MTTKLVISGLALLVGTGYGAAALAQQKPEVLVKQRQSAMTLVGKYWGPIAGMPSGKAPYNAETVTRNAGYLEVLSKMPWDGFVAGTKDVKSATLPAAYSEPAKFKEAEDKLLAETAKLVAVTKTGDETAIKAQILAVDKACGGCHES